MNIGANIRYFRELHNLTQNQLAKKIGVSSKTISAWEIGRIQPKIKYITALCEAFDCKTSDLTDKPFVNPELNEEQKETLALLSRATPEQKDAFVELLRSLYS